MSRPGVITLQLEGHICAQELYDAARRKETIVHFLTAGDSTPFIVRITHVHFFLDVLDGRFDISGTIFQCQPGCHDCGDLLRCTNTFKGIYNTNRDRGTFNINVTIDD